MMTDIALKLAGQRVPDLVPIHGTGAGYAQNLGTLSDEELLKRVATKNGVSSGSLGILFQRHATPLLRFLSTSLNNDSEAEDLVQDTFIRIAEKADTFRGE